jgi:hypothetical protein
MKRENFLQPDVPFACLEAAREGQSKLERTADTAVSNLNLYIIVFHSL